MHQPIRPEPPLALESPKSDGQKIAAALEAAVTPLGLAPAERSATVERFVWALSVLEQTDDDEAEVIG